MDYDDMCEMLRILTIPLGPMAADKASSIITKQINITRLHDALRAAGLLE